jgi:serine phosphatase RsbU (regulator of sigma subunit)/PAS domain-containing protein
VRAPLDVLTAVGRELATARDEEEALASMAPLLVPAIADWVSVGVWEADGRIRRVAVVHADPALADDARRLAEHPALVPPGPVGTAAANPTGHVLVYEEVDDAVLARTGIGPEVRALYDRLGCRSAASLALVSRGRLLGGILLAHGPSGRRFTAEDLPALEDLARRCAAAVDGARLRREAESAASERDALLATAPVAMALVGPDGSLLRLNEAMAALSECSVDECRGRPLGEAIPDLADALVPLVDRATAGSAVEHAEVRRDGRVWAASAYPVHGGAGAAATGVVLVEVTRERAAAAEVARRAAEQGAVADLGREAIAGTPVEGLVALAAAAVASTVGADLVPGEPAGSGEVAVLGPADPPGPLVARRADGEPVPDADAAFLRTVGTTLAAAAARQRAEDDVRDSRRRLVMALEAGGMGSFEWDLATGSVRWSEALSTALVVGLGAEHPVGAVVDAVHPDDRARLVDEARRAVDEGGGFEVVFRVVDPAGEARWVEARGSVFGDRVVGVAMDVTDRLRAAEVERVARVEAEAARERLAFLAEASAVLSGSLDAAETFATVARLAVPRLADWCVVDALDDTGRLQQVALAHRDPDMVEAVVASRRRRLAAGGPGLWSARRVAATGESQLVADITDADLAAATAGPDHLDLLRRLDPRSAVVVPLVARGRAVGALTLVATGGSRRYGRDDLALAEDLARRAAVAADNAMLFEERSRVASILQRSLLPPALPEVAGMDLAARYRPSAGGADISGDFYDVFETGDGALVAVIGDVCGKGPDAAALTGLFRNTVRAAAVRARSPRRVLAAVNEALLGQVDDSRFGSAAFLRLTRDGDRMVVAMASGGHPLPVVVRAGGTVAPVDCAGTVLGVVPSPVLEERTELLEPGDAVVLYTDGVTEARRAGELFGDDRLLEVLAGVAGAPAAEVAAAVEGAALAFQGGVSDDDLAVLVLRVVAPATG